MNQPTPVTQGQRLRAFRSEGFALTETRHPCGMVLARHAHEHACINFVLEGLYDERIPGVPEQRGPLGLIFKPAWAEHANRFEHASARCLLIELVDAGWADPELDLAAPVETRDPRAARLALSLWRWVANPGQAASLAIDELALELYALVLGRRAGRSIGARSPGLRAATELLHDDPGAPWRLSRLAAAVGLHPSHLARIFRARHGTTIGAYLRQLRLVEAGRRLALEDQPLADVAQALGFADQSHLTRVFRSAMGVSPGAFRRAMGNARARNSRSSAQHGPGSG